MARAGEHRWPLTTSVAETAGDLGIVCFDQPAAADRRPPARASGFPNHDFQHCDGVVAGAVLLCRRSGSLPIGAFAGIASVS